MSNKRISDELLDRCLDGLIRKSGEMSGALETQLERIQELERQLRDLRERYAALLDDKETGE